MDDKRGKVLCLKLLNLITLVITSACSNNHTVEPSRSYFAVLYANCAVYLIDRRR